MVKKAQDDGITLAEFKKDFIKNAQAKGWTVRGETKDAKYLGWRAKLIYQTSMRSSYMAGTWRQIQETKDLFTYLRYSAVLDNRTRPKHRAWHGVVRRVDDPFWMSHYPPNGYLCRCTVIQMDAAAVKEEGLKVSDQPFQTQYRDILDREGKSIGKVPDGINPGWDHNVGVSSAQVEKVLSTKIAELPAAVQAAILKPLQVQNTLTTVDDYTKTGKSIVDALKYDDFDSLHSQIIDKLSQEVGISTPAKIANRSEGAALVNIASQLFPDSWTKAADEVGRLFVKLDSSANPRGWSMNLSESGKFRLSVFGAVDAKANDGFITVRKNTLPNAIHEYAHRLQFALPELNKLFVELHKQRTNGDPLESLKSLHPLRRFNKNEFTRKDKYIAAYQGKEYNGDPREVMTMAFEMFLSKNNYSSKLLTDDRSMLDLIIGLLFYWKP